MKITLPTRVATIIASLATMMASTAVFAGDPPPPPPPVVEPAVSGINGKLDAHYGRVYNTYSRGVSGSLSVPVGVEFGLQVDGLYAHANDDDFYGLGGHFFTRNPNKGLIGVVASGLYSGAVESYLAGVEGEYYLEMVTFGAMIAYNNVQTDVPLPVFNPQLATQDDFVYAHIYASIYPIDDLMVRFDYHNVVERNIYGVTLEYQTPLPGLCLFGSFALGDNDYRHAFGGVRYYFGGKKSLKHRHRQDDPPNAPSSNLPPAIAAGAGFAPAGFDGEKPLPE